MKIPLLIASLLVAFASTQLARRRPNRIKNVHKIDDDQIRVVCYYTNWSVYRKGLAKYTPQNINPYMCTHLIYAFGGMTDDFEVTTFDSYQDIDKAGYSQFNGLKQYNRGLKTLLAIGGWNEGSPRFSEMVAYPEYRNNFTRSAIKHLRRYKFDGLDLDWEYPAAREGSAPEDKENYATFVQELREAFEEEGRKVAKGRLLLTMAVPAGLNYIDKGYDVPKLNKYLDFINILSYDYHSVNEPSVNHHAPLMGTPGASEYEWNAQLNVAETVKYYLSKGASKNKLIVGIPTYGRSYTLLDPAFPELGSSADGPGIKGNYTNEKGYMAFFEICEAISSHGWEVRKPYPKRIGPIAFKGDQWVGYDDEHIAARKAEYVRDAQLGGIMFWSLDSADFRGICNGKRYPLIEAAKAALLGQSAEAENEARSFKSSTNNKQGTNNRNLKPINELPGSRRRPDESRRQTIDPFNTPEPPTTPTTTATYNCKREGFYPNPDDCHKYFWCLGSGTSGLGIVPHAFTCPSGLIFNKRINGCDNPGPSVKCKTTGRKGPSRSSISTTPIPTTTAFDYTLLDDYDYYYYDYLYDDYILNETIPTEAPLVQNNAIKNSAGSQFGKHVQVEPVISSSSLPFQHEAESTSKSPSQRTRPQYSSIDRERPQITNEENIEALFDVQNNENIRKPEYVTINRQKPNDLGNDNIELHIQPGTDIPTTDRSLHYVTINRKNQPTESSRLEINEIQSSTRPGVNYVTISRNRPSTESSSSVDSLLEYTTTSSIIPPTIETSSTQLPRIKIPAVFTKKPGRRLPSRRKIELIRDSGKIESSTQIADSPILLTETEVKIIDTVPEKSINSLPVPGRRRRPTLTLEERRQSARDQSRAKPKPTIVRIQQEETIPPLRNELDVESKQISNNRHNTRRDPLFQRTRQPSINAEPINRTRQRLVASPAQRPHVRNPFDSLDALLKKKDVNTVKSSSSELSKPDENQSVIIEKTPLQEQSPMVKKGEMSISQKDTLDDKKSEQVEEFTEDTLLTLIRPEKTELPDEIITEKDIPTSEKTTIDKTVPELKINKFLRPKPVLPESESTSYSPFSFIDIISSSIPKAINDFQDVVEVIDTTTESIMSNDLTTTTTEESNQRTQTRTAVRTTIPFGQSSTTPPLTTFKIRESFRKRTKPLSTSPVTTNSAITTPLLTAKQHTTSLSSTTEDQTARLTSTEPPTSILPQATNPPTSILPQAMNPPTTRRFRTTNTPTTERSRTTNPPTSGHPETTKPPITRRPSITRRSTTRRPKTTTPFIPEYEYVYDYYNEGGLGGDLGQLAMLTQKATVTSDGKIKCFDTGYFPHPNSCKKFISCSKTVRGQLKGWTYTCPQNLVFDPVGGMCNWSEDVDCLS